MSRTFLTAVDHPVVCDQMIDVVNDKAIESVSSLLHKTVHRNIDQLAAVKCPITLWWEILKIHRDLL